ncbi:MULTISPECIES: DUF4328 domain-containing protein [unclassified Dietzia]|uniref:DUF4328 domain-containing protein n=1 Tax=unclassified Dietzia TaxID=2617939 RepID=UPI001E5D35F3|nr:MULTISPECIES: DUF4328 domain-containing protein [unclassified Dietzia]
MTSPRRTGQWRWVAHPPWRPPVPGARPPAPRHRSGPAWGDRTPTYPATPRWGLPPVAIPRRLESPRPPARPRIAAAAPGVVGVAGTWFAATAVVHALRYAVLAWYSERLTPWWVEATTTAVVWVAGVVAVVVGMAAAVAATAWLVDTRRRVFSPAPDPRRRAGLWVGCLVPVVNWFRIPVYLAELRVASRRAPTRAGLIRWWVALGVNGLAVALALWRGTGQGPQAAADTVLLTALAAAAAVWAARETRTVMRSFDEPPPRFTHRLLPRGIVNASPAREE